MKKSKILVLALTSVMATSVFGLAGCTGGGGNGGGGSSIEHTQHTYGNWEHNATQHWRKCTSSGCTAEEREDHKYNGGYTCEVCGYVNESLKPGESQSMSTYFSGMKTKYVRQNILDADKSSKSFDQILDNQIDMLARDILYRLNYVYGTDGTNTYVRPVNSNYNLNYSLNGANALVKVNTLLSNNSQHEHALNALNADCLECYQQSISTTEQNRLNGANSIILAGAINGNYTSLVDDTNTLDFNAVSENAWNYYKQFNDIQSTNAKAYLKYGIAQILAGKTVGTSYSVSEYTKTLNSIETLGFNANIKSDLEKFIYNYIIGSELTTKDLKVYNCQYFKTNGYLINSKFVMNAPYNDTIDNTYSSEEISNSPRLYKGYNIVVPAIVKQALSNTFEGTTQTIYPSMSRYATDYSSNAFTTSTSNFDSIVLAPRTSTPATKLVVKIEGTGNNVELTIGCSVNGSNASSNQKKVRLSASGETVEFDLHSYSTIGSYNGSTEKDTKNDLFANNQTSKNSSDGSNYIKLVFTNPSNAMFRVTFTGYYNK